MKQQESNKGSRIDEDWHWHGQQFIKTNWMSI